MTTTLAAKLVTPRCANVCGRGLGARVEEGNECPHTHARPRAHMRPGNRSAHARKEEFTCLRLSTVM